MRVLLLRPVPANERFGLGPFFRIEPLGMEYIAAALEARGHEVTLADLRFTSLDTHLDRVRPGLVGKSIWKWLGEVDVRNAMFLLGALSRTQRMMDPSHYLAECDFASPLSSFTASFAADARRSLERSER